MNEQLWWHLARSSGIVAWALSVLAILWGLALSTKAAGTSVRPAWLLDLHRFLGTLTVAFLGIHVGALVADSYLRFGWAEILVPMTSTWRPGAVTWGVVAAYALVAVQVSSLLMRRLPRRIWRTIHLTSYLVYVSGTIHAVTAGTDDGAPLRWSALASAAAITFFTLYRALAPRRRQAGRKYGARTSASTVG